MPNGAMLKPPLWLYFSTSWYLVVKQLSILHDYTHLHTHTHICTHTHTYTRTRTRTRSTHLHTLWVTQILLQSTIIIATTWTHSSHYIGHAATSWPPNLSSKQQASQAHTHNIIILLSNLHVALIFFLSPWLHSPKYCNSIPENFCWTEILPYPPAFAL